MTGKPAEGSCVYLNSGSPKLTVTGINEKGAYEVQVAWFDALNQPQSAMFPAACLTETDPGADPDDRAAPSPKR